MNKKIAAVVAALVLALLGVVALVSYASNADDRALENVELATVLQVTTRLEPLATVEAVRDSVDEVEIPKLAVVPGALTSLDEVAGLVTASVLVPGDQLTAAKFAKPDDVVGDVKLPKGKQELTIPLAGARTVGGALAAGDKAGVFISDDGKTANPINELLLLRVQGVVAEDGTAGEPLLTFAVSTRQAQAIVHGMEFGKVWLSKQDDDTEHADKKTVTQSDVAP
ncbi:hypothetical protein [Aeromicrobium sp. UC242_57]|uniref:hypothetical protein n=1 Tax=Aeromicrobium sp. UC242_57 TaxID=3374624 RepID=UPI0037A11D43